jgi:RHS repeat-associated protein
LASANCPATVNENAGRSYLILVNSGDADSFKYDPFGRRIYKSSSSGTSVYAYDGDNLIEETNASGGVVARYSQGLNIDEPLAMLRGGTTSYYQADGLGSLTSLSNTSGALANTYTYDSFGSLTASTGSLTNSFRYTGREFDAETSLYYYRARYYDAASGRFTSEDPLGFYGGDTNLYRYVLNSPSNLQDPTGNCPMCVTVLVGALSGAAIDAGIQLIQNGGNFRCLNWKSIGIAAAAGAATSALFPTGPLLGRGGARAIPFGYPESPGLLNQSWYRFGWGYSEKAGGDLLRVGLGRSHIDVPFTTIPAGANPLRDGGLAGALAGGATGLARPSGGCGCQ